MSLAAALLVAAAACSWDAPGNNRYSGSVLAAVDNYKDIPNNVRNILKQRINAKHYDDIATIGKWGIQGKYGYSDLRQMHFGTNQICGSVSTDKWLPTQQELGLVFCEEEHCIIIPTVCGNVSRITRHTTPNNISFLQAREYTDTPAEKAIEPLKPVAFSLSETEETDDPIGETAFPDNSFTSYRFTNVPFNLPISSGLYPTAFTAPIPEPSTYVLTVLGLLAVAAFNWFRKRK